MGKRVDYTPASKIRNMLRMLFLRSRERARTMKASEYACQKCGAKQSRARGREVYVECHHKYGIDWDGLIVLIRDRLLSGELEVLCKECHEKETKGE